MLLKLKRILEWTIPEEVRRDPVKRPRFYFISFASLFCGVVVAGISVTRIIAEKEFQTNNFVTLSVAALLLINVLLPKWIGNIRPSSFAIAFLPLALVPANLFVPGTMISRLGIFSGAIPLFPTCVLAAVMLLGLRWGVVSLLVAIGQILGLFYLHKTGQLPIPPGYNQGELLIHTFATIAPSIYALAVSFVFLKTIDLWQSVVDKQRASAADQKRVNMLSKISGGVAHEVNNPLAIIATLARKNRILARQNRLSVRDVEEAAENIITQTNRIESIVSSLLFIGNEFSVTKEVEIQASEFLEELRFELPHINFKTTLLNNAKIVCKAEELKKAVKSLLQNSFDACKDNAAAFIEVIIDRSVDGTELTIAVRDNGNGIPETNKEAIFEPFFSTKPIGEGKGLGLSVARGIAESHGGSLILNTKSNVTEFVISLPVSTTELRSAS